MKTISTRFKATRLIFAALAALLLVGAVALTACSSGSDNATNTESTTSSDNATSSESEGNKTITVGASPTPHAQILNDVVKPLLADQGYDLEVVEFTDYVLPNTATEEGEVDANYFQHGPYLEEFNETRGTHLVSVAEVHFEPFALYSDKLTSLDDLADGATIAVPNDATNEARALLLLEQEGLIEVDDAAGLTATVNDITANPKNLVIREIEAANLPNVLPDVDVAAINGNYALGAGLNSDDALAVEADDSLAAETYANVLVVKEGNENNEAIQALAAALTSPEVKEYLEENFPGAVVAVF